LIGHVRPEKVQDALRWLTELTQHDGRGLHRLFKELNERKTLIDRWCEGEVWLHLNVRFRSSLFDVEPCEFCTWLKRADIAGRRGDSPNDAIGCAKVADRDAVRYRDDWRNRSVLVSVRQVVKNRKDMPKGSGLAC
jgi:hypothetical protein